MSVNVTLVKEVLEELGRRGVSEFCVCPGSRNSPWVSILAHYSHQFRVFYHYEERSAAFFALGRIRASGKPVAVITTSGTAAAELLPAVMEAHYTAHPLIVITADRPRHYRLSGAPQTAEQVGLFGVYVEACIDLQGEERPQWSELRWERPIHFNTCFDEPLIDAPMPSLDFHRAPVSLNQRNSQSEQRSDLDEKILGEYFSKVHQPLVLVGLLAPSERAPVKRLLLRWKCPVYLEATSGLREDPELSLLQIHLSDSMLSKMKLAQWTPDGLIRLGGIPTPRIWRDLDVRWKDLEVLSLSSTPFSGLGRPSHLLVGEMKDLEIKVQSALAHLNWNFQSQEAARFLEDDQRALGKLQELIRAEPHSEPGWIAKLSELMPRSSRVFLGNSMPIREWSLAATREHREFEMWASRGLSGIEGQISTFLGFSDPCQSNWGVFGDLTTLYDLAGPWMLSQIDAKDLTVVVINNGGGKIFSRMYPQKEFQNQHHIQFRSWANLWGLEFHRLEKYPLDFTPHATCPRILEVCPDERATHRFFEEYQRL